MSAQLIVALVLLAPAAAWALAWAAARIRDAWLTRRGHDDQSAAGRAAAGLRHRFVRSHRRGREVVAVRTGAVDLAEADVRAVAAECGYRLLGYERGRGPWRARLGVFVLVGGDIDAVIRARTAPAR